MQVPVGPVAVFGASNFPLAFSTAGGDTASALAAGCPVVVKGHPAHPRTGSLVAEQLSAAVADAGLPAGTFGHVLEAGFGLAERLVRDDRIEAVAFTGSLRGGQAIIGHAAERPRPIPVYAEMGSLNPVIVTETALRARAADIADGLAASVATFGGQLCTKPGIVLFPAGAAGEGFCALVGERLAAAAQQVLLTKAIADGFAAGLAEVDAVPGVTRLGGTWRRPPMATATRLRRRGPHRLPRRCGGAERRGPARGALRARGDPGGLLRPRRARRRR